MRNPNSISWWRGEKWEEAMVEYGMTCLNVGDEWTYFKSDSNREEQGLDPINSIIDVCFCSNNLASLVSNWMVRDCATGSDHASIEMCFHIVSNNTWILDTLVFCIYITTNINKLLISL